MKQKRLLKTAILVLFFSSPLVANSATFLVEAAVSEVGTEISSQSANKLFVSLIPTSKNNTNTSGLLKSNLSCSASGAEGAQYMYSKEVLGNDSTKYIYTTLLGAKLSEQLVVAGIEQDQDGYECTIIAVTLGEFK